MRTLGKRLAALEVALGGDANDELLAQVERDFQSGEWLRTADDEGRYNPNLFRPTWRGNRAAERHFSALLGALMDEIAQDKTQLLPGAGATNPHPDSPYGRAIRGEDPNGSTGRY